MELFLFEILQKIFLKNKVQQRFLEKAMQNLKMDELKGLYSYLQFCQSQNLSSDFLTNAYLTIVNDTFQQQLFFAKHKKYKFSSFKEVANAVYFDKNYMQQYMHGLALTSFFWPNHLSIKRFFESRLPKGKKGTYLEIGPGHGLYFLTALQQSQYSKFIGIDISPTSLGITKSAIESKCFGIYSNYLLIEQDFLNWNTNEKFDAIILGEVLEHVEEPTLFLNKVASLSSSNGYIFISTCIDAPAIDHIFHYKAFSEIEHQISEAKLQILDKLLCPYGNLSIEITNKNRLPINVALVLGHE